MLGLDKLTISELKAVAISENVKAGEEVVDVKGSKKELIDSILRHFENRPAELTPDINRYNTNPSSFLVNSPHIQNEEKREAEKRHYLNPNRLSQLEDKIRNVLQGKAKFVFRVDQPDGSSTVEFNGAPRGQWSQTLMAPDAAILTVARNYVQRAFIGESAGLSLI